MQSRIIERVLERARRKSGAGVVIFDLDSTLFDNRPRQARILREFGAARGLAELAGVRSEHWQGWDIRVAMRNAGMSPEAVAAAAPDAKQFWRERFFTSAYCVDDVPIAGAAAYVQAIAASGAQVAYVTGRHTEMGPGTIECLGRHAFPVPGGRTSILLKPEFTTTDDDWKIIAHAKLRSMGDVVAAFDNEPAHANGYRASFPDALIVHLATDHSGRDIKLLEGIESIPNFAEFVGGGNP